VHIFLLCVFYAWVLLVGLYGRYFYIVLFSIFEGLPGEYKVHDTSLPSECVPAAFLAFLRHVVVASSHSALKGVLEDLQGDDAKTQLLHARWCILSRNEDLPPSPPGTLMAIGTLSRTLDSLGLSAVLLLRAKSGGEDFAVCRVGAAGPEVALDALFFYEAHRTHLVCVTWPTGSSSSTHTSPVIAVAPDAARMLPIEPQAPVSFLCAGGLAGGAPDFPSLTPSFCESIRGGSNTDGQPHGLCVASILHEDLQIDGHWERGLPHSLVVLRPKNSSTRQFSHWC
jgi:hypothetical protein